MLVLARPETSSLLRWLAVAVILVAGVFVLALCAEGACSTCAHEYCGSTDRSKHPVLSFARRLQTAFVILLSAARSASLSAAAALSLADIVDLIAAPQLRQATLRI